MRVYLDNWKSVKNKPNENQGRELLELHTVGRDAGYTEAMVKASAVLLSGYTVDWGKTFDAKYDPNAHTTGAVQVLDFTHANATADGQAATVAYLKYLAHHPATAAGSPPSSPPTSSPTPLRRAGRHARRRLPELRHRHRGRPEGAVERTRSSSPPRASRCAPRSPTWSRPPACSTVDVQAPVRQLLGQRAPTTSTARDRCSPGPDPTVRRSRAHAWSAASRVFACYGMHRNQAGGWWPKEAATYRTAVSWLPTSSLRFDAYVDHLCRTWLGRRPTRAC